MSAVLVHGAGAGAWEWNVWLGVLRAHGIDPHALELQPTAAGLAMTSLEAYASQVRDRLSSLPRPRVLVGASLGGLLAAMCAADADALVLVNTVPCRPWHSQLPPRHWSDVVYWQRDARLATTRDGLDDADAASALFAYRRWRDESGTALGTAWAGVEVDRPACPVLFLASHEDEDVPPTVSFAMAGAWGARMVGALTASHLGPLLGKAAAPAAEQAVAWLNHALPSAPGSDRVGKPSH